jgi:hypothetical protein
LIPIKSGVGATSGAVCAADPRLHRRRARVVGHCGGPADGSQPIDVVTFDSFSAFRKRMTGTVGATDTRANAP